MYAGGVRPLLANLLGPMVCDPWAIENSLHWVLDMIFRGDDNLVSFIVV